MGRPSIDYLIARRALKPANGGKVYPRRAKYAPEEDRPPDDDQTTERLRQTIGRSSSEFI
jgi:hypothetical protein